MDKIFITAVSFCQTGLHWLMFPDGQEIMVHLVNRGWLLQGSGGGGRGIGINFKSIT